MKATVTEDGVTIPKRMLEGVSEVEIRKKADGVLVVPLKSEEPTTRADIGGQGRLMADALARVAASGRISGIPPHGSAKPGGSVRFPAETLANCL